MGFEKEASSSSNRLGSFSLPREDTPLLAKPRPLSSQFKTFANVFIAIVGAGVLGLPYTFKKTGWITGLLMLFSVAFVTYYCMLLLVKTRNKIEPVPGCSKITSFGDLAYAVCGSVGRVSVDIMIILSQAGFCVSYLIFVAQTLAYVFNHSNQHMLGIKPRIFYMWACFPFQLGLNSIPTLTHLAPLSIFADVVDIGSMAVVMVEDVVMYLNQKPVLRAFGSWSVLFYGVGVAVYAFEGIGMVLPLEAETRNKAKFGKVLGLAMLFISLMYGGFGALGYFAFGDETRDIITTNLGRGFISYLVQLGLCVNLFFSFPLMMNPVYEIMERRFNDSRYCVWLRWVMVLGVTFVALVVPNFADFLSLVGSSVCVVLGFVLPALFHLMVLKNEMTWTCFVTDGLIVALGVVLSVTGSWTALVEIFAATT